MRDFWSVNVSGPLAIHTWTFRAVKLLSMTAVHTNLSKTFKGHWWTKQPAKRHTAGTKPTKYSCRHRKWTTHKVLLLLVQGPFMLIKPSLSTQEGCCGQLVCSRWKHLIINISTLHYNSAALTPDVGHLLPSLTTEDQVTRLCIKEMVSNAPNLIIITPSSDGRIPNYMKAYQEARGRLWRHACSAPFLRN